MITKEIEEFKKVGWKPVFIKIPINGKPVEFAVKKAPKGEANFLYNANSFRIGVVGKPIGQFIETQDGKKKFKFYK